MDYFLKLPGCPKKEGHRLFLLNYPGHTAAPIGSGQATSPAYFPGSLDTSDYLTQLKNSIGSEPPTLPLFSEKLFSHIDWLNVLFSWPCKRYTVCLTRRIKVECNNLLLLMVRSIPDTQLVIITKADPQEHHSFSYVCSKVSEIVWFSD